MNRRFICYNPSYPGKNFSYHPIISNKPNIHASGTAANIRKLHFEINAVEEVYDDATQMLINLPTSQFPLSFGVKFHEMHTRVERLLVKLLDFFHISVDPSLLPTTEASQGTHRYHIAVLEAFTKPDNPLHNQLGDKATQDVLRAWRLWRNKWVRKTSIDEMQQESTMKNLRKARAEMPLVMEKLRVAVSFTNALARTGALIVQHLDDGNSCWRGKRNEGSSQHSSVEKNSPGQAENANPQTKTPGRAKGTARSAKNIPAKKPRKEYPWMSILAHEDNH